MVVGEQTRLGVQVLGDLAVAGSGARPLGGPTQRRAFAALVVHRNETTTIDQLVDACWPDGDVPRRAEHNVRTYVHRLRGAFGEHDGRIETAANGYKLRLESAETDIDRFEQLAGEAGRLIDVGEPVAALDRLDGAESLWHGRPYAEFADEPWVEAEVARLDELHLTIGERRAEALLAAGRPGDAVGVLERLVREEPYRERPRALLMRALYESGRPTEALRAFQDFRRFLIDDAGVEPSTDLVDLDRRIASGTLDRSTPTRHVGNYELHERIGEGAFAVVHRATQTSLGRDVAVKIVRAELADRPEFIRRFEAEAQMVAAIEHPHVVPLYDYWREPGNAYLVMRWMIGGSLETRLDRGPLAVDDVVQLVDEVAAALDAAHAHDVVHRDVKPANILFDDAGRALLGDFGIALAADERSTPQAALSEGSPIYASPEQLRREPVGPEADVHALGIVAFAALTGRIPFQGVHDDADLLRRRLTDPVPAVSTLQPDLPLGLDDVIATATAKRPEDRYPTAGAFAAAFRSAAGGDLAAATRRIADRSNPYLGLRAFTEADAALFHGRSRLVDELVAACAHPDRRLLSVVGPSGSGKSSVVRAGLVPALRSGRVAGSARWFLTTMVPGARPYEALETALLRVATNPPSALLDQLRDGDRGIHRGVSRIVPDDGDTVLVVIDQFEELFTVTDDAERHRFLRALTTAVTEPGGRLRVVATLRADFFDQPLRHPVFAPVFKASAVAITPLAPDELEEAITAPAAAVGARFEPGLIAEIIADVNSQPGALPLLQYALTQTFDAADAATLTTEGYREVGGLAGALARRAETLHTECSDDERRALRRLLGRLVALGEGTEDTRRRVHRSELPGDAATDRVIERFGAARLLTFDRDPATREPTVEIAHEALLREWPRLREWLDDDRDALRTHRHLTASATAWAARDRDPDELHVGARLVAAEALLRTPTIGLNPVEHDFLSASIERRERDVSEERRRVRRLHRLVMVTAVVAAVAIVAGSIAAWQQRRADRQAARAEAAALTAESARTDAEREAAAAEEARAEADENALAALEALDDAAAQRRRAEDSASEARAQAAEAAAQRDAADVERLRANALLLAGEELSLLLAVEANHLDPSMPGKEALLRALTVFRGTGDSPLLWDDDGPLVESLTLPIDQVEMLQDPTARLSTAVVDGGDAILTSVTVDDRVSTVARHERVQATITGPVAVPSRFQTTDLGIEATVSSSGDYTVWIADRIEVHGPDGGLVGAPIPRPSDVVSAEVSSNGEIAVIERRGGVLDVVSTSDGPIGTVTVSGARPDDEFGLSLLADGSMFSARSLFDESTAWALWRTDPLELVSSGISGFEGTSRSESQIVSNPILHGRLMYSDAYGGASLRSYDPATGQRVGQVGPLFGVKLAALTVSDDHDLVAVANFSLDGPFVVGAVELFDMTSGAQIGDDIPVLTPSSGVTIPGIQTTRSRFDIEFDAAGRLVVQHRDRVEIWNLDASSWVDLACALAGRNMNREQWDRYGPTGVEFRRTCPQYPIET